MIARRLLIAGRVQGVGFREGLVGVALDTGVAGWVRNTRDGAVEALVQGDDAVVEAVIAWCRRGPPAARVSTVDVSVAAVDPGLRSFVRRPTH